MHLQLNLPTQPPWGQKKVAIVGEVAVIDCIGTVSPDNKLTLTMFAKKVATVERWTLVEVDCVL